MERTHYAPGEAKGAPDHPHRGFETVTYVLEGGMIHRDSAGNSGKLKAGDVQWMTAGSGIIHSELPLPEILERGGTMHGFQVWVNLPRRDKMIAPRYQDTPGENIPVVRSSDGRVTVKIIAGESLGGHAVIQTRTPIIYLHVKMEPGGTFVQDVPGTYSALAYVIDGELRSNGESATADHMMLFACDGDGVVIEAGEDGANFLLLAGQALNEPIARYGPFVMNTQTEIAQAIDDYQSGQFGRF